MRPASTPRRTSSFFHAVDGTQAVTGISGEGNDNFGPGEIIRCPGGIPATHQARLARHSSPAKNNNIFGGRFTPAFDTLRSYHIQNGPEVKARTIRKTKMLPRLIMNIFRNFFIRHQDDSGSSKINTSSIVIPKHGKYHMQALGKDCIVLFKEDDRFPSHANPPGQFVLCDVEPETQFPDPVIHPPAP